MQASTPPFNRARQNAIAAAILIALGATAAYGQETTEEDTWSPPGLPSGLDWTFNFDATFGVFSFGNSLYTDPRPDQPSGDLTANWMEGSLKPALSAEYTTSSSAQFYGKLSGVGMRTYGGSPSAIGGDANSFELEDFHIGWRSGNSLDGLGEDALEFTVGRSRYRLGNGLLLWDGAAEGGSRGGYWTAAAQAFEMAVIGKFKLGNNLFEAFYLERDELPESKSGTELTGFNYEYSIGEDTTLGGTYMQFSADPEARPERDGMNVYNLRAYSAPFRNKALSFELEYALEDNGSLIDSTAYNALVAYQLDMRWQPKISYRYALFEGDNPATSTNESFDSLLGGFSDWGSWWQGEIAGEYFLTNSNLASHQLRVHTSPSESISTGLILWNFLLDQVAESGDPDDVAIELDWYMDWTVNDNFIVSFVAAIAEPGDAVEASSGRDDMFVYAMIYAAYSF